MGHVRSCVLSRRHSFDPVFMKLCQNVYLHQMSNTKLVTLGESKTRSPCQILEKPCVHFRGHVLMQSSYNFAKMFFSIKSRPGPKMGHVRLKTRSQGQFVVKP